jgi:hypothetical protein
VGVELVPQKPNEDIYMNIDCDTYLSHLLIMDVFLQTVSSLWSLYFIYLHNLGCCIIYARLLLGKTEGKIKYSWST